MLERARVVDHIIGRFDLLLVRELRSHAAGHFFARRFQVDFLARGKTLRPLLGNAGDYDHTVEAFGRACFQQQCRLHDRRAVWILNAHGLHPVFLAANDRGMHNAIEFVDSRAGFSYRGTCGTKCHLRQFRAIHAAIRIENPASKVPDHLVVNRLSRLHQGMRDTVCLHHMRPQRREHFPHHRLPRGNPACKADFQHQSLDNPFFTTEAQKDGEEFLSSSIAFSVTQCLRGGFYARDHSCTRFPRRIFAALSVLNISIAMVSGPTPPGTGVSAPATSATSGCTSPISVDPFLRNVSSRLEFPAKNLWNSAGSVTVFMPTSITVAPGFTKSRVIIPARPMAATRMSALRHTAGRSCVFEWQTVTVALALINSMAAGLPTISLRPTTTASCPEIGIWLRFRISITPAGVHGTRPGRWVERKPTFMGWNPSTSFPGSTARSTFFESTCGGSGNCTRMPSISSRRLRSSISASNSAVLTDSGGVSFSL